MAEMDMGLSPNNNNKKRKKKKKQSLGKSIVTGLFPCKGDSSSEVARKIIFLGSLCLMIAALVIIAVHFITLLKPEAPIGTTTVDQNGSQVIEDGQMVVVNPNAPTKEQIEKLRAVGFNDHEILEAAFVAGFFNYTNRWVSTIAPIANPGHFSHNRNFD